jgi:hypothetical protein
VGSDASPDLQSLLQRAVDVTGQKQAAAKAIGISPQRFSRLFHKRPGSYALSVQSSMNLARLLGEPPEVILRAQGKNALAKEMTGVGDDRPRATPIDPLEQGLAEIAREWKGSRPALLDFVNSMRTVAGLPKLAPRHGRRSA